MRPYFQNQTITPKKITVFLTIILLLTLALIYPGVAQTINSNVVVGLETKITGLDTSAFDGFGHSVAISGDTAVVGTAGVYDSSEGPGSAYVYTLSHGFWIQQAKLTPTDRIGTHLFGTSVAISGDTVVVGKDEVDEDSGFESGAAYVFTRSNGVWAQQAKLTASDGAAYDSFGTSVAVSGDTMVVGARFDDNATGGSGSAYVFTMSDGIWTQEAKLTASDAANIKGFGGSVAISGNTVVVGASDSDKAGSAYVFTRLSGLWTQQAKLTASDVARGDLFGASLAISNETIVVGASQDDDMGSNSGSAYVFTRSDGVWTQQAKLIASDVARGDLFGASVAVSNDTVVVGASQDDDAGRDSGSTYVFTRSDEIWIQQVKFIASGVAKRDSFGWSVAVSGDTAVAGAFRSDDAGVESGSASIFEFIEDNEHWVTMAFGSATSSIDYDADIGHPVSVRLTIPGGGVLEEPISVEVIDSGTGTATLDSDYVGLLPQTVVFPAGSVDGAVQSVTIQILPDSDIEADETINLVLSNSSAPATIGVQYRHQITIYDDERRLGKIYWSTTGYSGGEIIKANLDGTDIENFIAINTVNYLYDVIVDEINRKIYWFDTQLPYSINRINFDGHRQSVLIEGRGEWLRGYTLDFIRGKIYWTDEYLCSSYCFDDYGNLDHDSFVPARIGHADLDGRNAKTLFELEDDFISPRTIEVDPIEGKLYWGQYSNGDVRIRRANLDGSERENIILNYDTFTLDIYRKKIYVFKSSENTIIRFNLDGSDEEKLISGVDDRSIFDLNLDLVNDKIYWLTGDYNVATIHRANLDGSDIEDVVELASQPNDIYLSVIPDGFVEFSSATSATLDESMAGHRVAEVRLNILDGGVLSAPVTVEVTDVGAGNAVVNGDYSSFPPATLVFPAGSADGATQSLDLNVLSDTLLEDDETVVVQITGRTGPVALGTQLFHIVSITDDDGVIPEAVDDVVETLTPQLMTIDVIDNDSDADGSLLRFVAEFDGLDDSITWGDLEIDGTSALSKFIRFRTTDPSGVLFDVEFGGGADAGLALIGGHLQLRAAFYNSGLQTINLVTDDVAADGEWHSAGFIYNGVELQGYFDGQPAGTPVSLNDDTLQHDFPSVLGKRVISSSNFFAGQLSDFVVYDAAISDADIGNYHNGIIRPHRLVLWGRLDEGDYSEGLMDFSFNRHTGIANGASPEQDLVSVVIVDPPASGTVVNHLDGTITYTPSAKFCTSDQFSYRVRDNNYKLSDAATVTISVSGSRLYVNHLATGGNNGSSWDNALHSLQDALTFATCMEEIWVAAGTYTPDIGIGKTPGDRSATFQLIENVGLYGGFNGTETTRDERDVRRNETILSGDLLGDDVEFTKNDENSYHVVTGVENAILDGFTITRGKNSGMFNDGTSIIINNCIFSYNKGSGLYNNEAPATISQVMFHRNQVGIRNKNTICNSPTVSIVNCIFTENDWGISQSFAEGTIDQNSSFHSCLPGGWSARARMDLRNCTFVANGASMHVCFSEFVQLVHGYPEIHSYGSVDIKNTILWDDHTLLISFPYVSFYESPRDHISISNSNVKALCQESFSVGSSLFRCFRGIDNNDANPLFVDAADPDGPDDTFGTPDDGLRLSSGSPGIETGTDVDAPTTDVLGVARPQGDTFDMGAYEFELPDSSVQFVSLTSEALDESHGQYQIVLQLVLPKREVLNSDASVDVIDRETGTATAGLDYVTFPTTTIRFPAGSKRGDTQSFVLEILQDSEAEDDETIDLHLTNFQGPINPGVKVFHSAIIADDDLGNVGPTAEDDEAETNQDRSVTIDLVGNDRDEDGSIDPSTVTLVSRPYVASFDGVDDKIIWGDLGLNGTSTISKFIRFRTTDTSAVLFDTQFGSGADGGLSLIGGMLRLRCAFNNAGVQAIDITTADIAANGRWHSAGFTYDGSTLTTYFDGVTMGIPISITDDTLRHHYPSTCGGRIFSNSGFFAGELADFVVYNAAVFPDDVRNFHNGEVRTDNLILWGKMDENDYSSGLADSSGNGNSGVNAGVVPVVGPAPSENGTLVNRGDGTVIYSPNPDFFGEDRFTYRVNDNKGASSNVATVSILVNGAPTGEDDAAETIDGESVVINVVDNDTDGDGTIDPATVQIVQPRYVASFDGMDDKIVWGDLGLNKTPSIAKFIRFRTTDTNGVLFDTQFGNGADGGLYLDGGMLRLRCAFNDAGVQTIDIVTVDTATDGTWHTAGFTYDGSTLTTYFDGAPTGTPLFIPDDTIHHNYLSTCGGRVLSNSGFFAGELADFAVYDTALSPNGVMNYHQLSIPTTGLILLGKMDEDNYSGGLADSSGTGHSGVSAGAVPILDPLAPRNPGNGSAVNNGDGTITYTPNTGFVGEDHFEYTVSDNDGAVSNVATVTITILPIPNPTADVEFTLASSTTAVESATDHRVSVKLTGLGEATIGEAIMIDVVDSGDGTATPDNDYRALPETTLTFPAGSGEGATQVVTLTVLDDQTFESDETIELHLANLRGPGVLRTPSNHAVVIPDGEAGTKNELYYHDQTGGFNDVLRRTGSSEVVMIRSDLTELAMDFSSGKMYYATHERWINRANLDGNNVENVFRLSGVRSITAMAIDIPGETLYWSNGVRINRMNLDGTDVTGIVTAEVSNLTDLSLDSPNNKVYWSDSSRRTIHRATLNGKNAEALISTELPPRSIGVDPDGNKIYWTSYSLSEAKIQRANLDGTAVEDLIVSGVSKPVGLTLDTVTMKLYWVDADTNSVHRANLDGSGVEELFRTGNLASLHDLAVDISNNTVYWAGGDAIQRALLDGSDTNDLAVGFRSPTDIAFDNLAEKLYWTDGRLIKRSNLNGTNVELIVSSGLTAPHGIDVDSFGGKVYWTEPTLNTIQQANLDGTDVDDLVSGLANPTDIAVDMMGRKLYWTNGGSNTIQRANLDGTDVDDFLTSNLSGASTGLQVNSFDGKLYWRDRDGIQRANLDGTGRETQVSSGVDLALDPFTENLYWIDSDIDCPGDAIWRSMDFDLSGAGEFIGPRCIVPNESVYTNVAFNWIPPAGSIAFADSSSGVNEDSADTHSIVVRLTVPGGGDLVHPVEVTITDTGEGSATEGVDYDVLSPVSVVFPAGSVDGSTQSIGITILADDERETEETIILSLMNPHGPLVFDTLATHEITINDDDNVAPVAVDDDAETAEAESIVINVVDNDADSDGTVEPSTVQIVEPLHVASFDGVDDKIIWGDLGLHGTPMLSKFIRFRTTDTSGVLFDTQFGSGADGGLYLSGGMVRLRCAFNDAGVHAIDIVSADAAADGAWHSAGFTYDGSTLTPYFDGVATGTPLAIPNDTIRHNYPSTCGGRVFSNSIFYAGELADFVVYNAGLSESEAMAYHTGMIPTGNLVLWGKMDDNDYSGGLADSSGSGHSGVSAGAVPILDPLAPITPENGSVVNHGDGTIIYTPNPGFVGEDHVDYTVQDDDGAVSNIATVTITIHPASSTAAVVSKFAMKTLKEATSPSRVSTTTESLTEMTGSQTVYEDAEDGTIEGWFAYGDGTVTNTEEPSGNRIIVTDGDVGGAPFRLGLADQSDWNNPDEFTASFRILMDNDAAVYFRVETTEGERYLCYRTGPDTAVETNDSVLCFDLNINPDGEWHTVSRNLANDLITALPSAKVLSVKDFYMFGSVKLDDLMLLNQMTD